MDAFVLLKQELANIRLDVIREDIRLLLKAMRLTIQLLASYRKKGGQWPSCQEHLTLVSDVIPLLRRQQPSLNLCERELIFLKPEFYIGHQPKVAVPYV